MLPWPVAPASTTVIWATAPAIISSAWQGAWACFTASRPTYTWAANSATCRSARATTSPTEASPSPATTAWAPHFCATTYSPTSPFLRLSMASRPFFRCTCRGARACCSTTRNRTLALPAPVAAPGFSPPSATTIRPWQGPFRWARASACTCSTAGAPASKATTTSPPPTSSTTSATSGWAGPRPTATASAPSC